MIYLLHGDDQPASRRFLLGQIESAKAKGQEIVRLEADSLNPEDLIQAISSSSFFGNGQLVVAEGIFSLPKSARQKTLLASLRQYGGGADLILWEKKPVGKVLQRSLPEGSVSKEFKLPALLFTFLEQVAPDNIAKALTSLTGLLLQQPAELVYFMLARQLRQLLLFKLEQKLAGPPWLVGKYQRQAGKFSLRSLLTSYRRLFRIEESVKTGQSPMPLAWHLQIWLAEMNSS